MNGKITRMDVFADRAKLARLWFVLFIVACIGFTFERFRLASAFEKQSQFIVMDSSVYYLPRTLDFTAAKDLHVGQVNLAVESLFDRGPSGLDHQERLKRLFEKQAYSLAIKRAQGESAEFEAKQIHQKVEIGKVQLLQVKDDSVFASYDGQLIRSGIFDGRSFVEVLLLKGRLTFDRNPNMLVNGAYPTVVRDFDVDIQPANSK